MATWQLTVQLNFELGPFIPAEKFSPQLGNIMTPMTKAEKWYDAGAHAYTWVRAWLGSADTTNLYTREWES